MICLNKSEPLIRVYCKRVQTAKLPSLPYTHRRFVLLHLRRARDSIKQQYALSSTIPLHAIDSIVVGQQEFFTILSIFQENATMETLTLPHLPDSTLQICLFNNVQNADFLRQQLLQGNTDFEYAFLDASVLLSRSHVLAACFRAITDSLNNRLKSRNVHSEIVFSLSPNNNVSPNSH